MTTVNDFRAARKFECCRQFGNLVREQTQPDRFVEYCACGRKHYVLEADPVVIDTVAKEAA